jgi:hypothetical protein
MMTGYIHRFAICSVLLLAACSRGGTEDPSVVLERAATNAQQLRSAAFDVVFSHATEGFLASGSANGKLADGGKRMAFSFEADVTMRMEGVGQTVSTAGEVVVAGENEAYVKLSSLDGSVLFLPGIGLVPDSSLGTWYMVGGSGSGSLDSGVSPDPSFIAAQAKTLVVTDDRSYETVDGHECYAYDVTVDPQKAVEFLAETASRQGKSFDRAAAETFVSSYDARGTVLIDAETFVIRKIDWVIEPASGRESADKTSFSIRLSEHDAPVEISPPSDAKPLVELLSETPLPAL